MPPKRPVTSTPAPSFNWPVFTTAAFVAAGAVVLYMLSSGIYTLREYEQGVLLRFGKYVSTVGPGLHFKAPLMDECIVVDMQEHSIRFPWGVDDNGTAEKGLFGSTKATTSTPKYGNDEPLILTGDLYAAVVEWNVIWKIGEPKDFVLSIASKDIQATINAVARSTMHRVVGDYSADEVLTAKREEVANEVLKQMRTALAEFKCGVEIVDLQLQRVTPPERVKPKFDEVNASIQQRDQLVNQARTERNKLMPLARANADKLVREAEGYAFRRRSEATGEISALLAKYESYKMAPELTRQRLYLETMERVFESSGQKIILDSQLKGMVPLLNLQEQKP